MNTIDIPISSIDDNPYQARTTYSPEGIERLAESIKDTGLLQPPMARLVDLNGVAISDESFDRFMADVARQKGSIEALLYDYRVQIAFGHRRLRAFYHLDAVTMPITLANLDEERMYILCYEENERRSELNAIEQAVSIDMAKQQFGWTDEEIAQRLKLDRSTVAKTRSLLRLPKEAQKKVASGEISKRNALALIQLYELPQSILDKGEQNHSDFSKPSKILKQAGTSTPVEIRQRIESLVSSAGKHITCDQEREHTDPRLQSPRCTGCALRRKGVGQSVLCFDEGCHAIKLRVEHEETLMEGIRRTGLAVLEEGQKNSIEWLSPERIKPFMAIPCEHRRITTDRANMSLVFDKELPRCYVACAAKKCECSQRINQQAQSAQNQAHLEERAERDKRITFIVKQFAQRLMTLDLGLWQLVASYRSPGSTFENDKSIEGCISSLVFSTLANAAATTVYNVRANDKEVERFEQWAVNSWGITPYSEAPTAVESLIAQLSELEQRVNGWVYVDGEEWYQCLTQLRVLRSQFTMVTGLDDINGRCAALASTLRHYENVNAVTSDDEAADDNE